MAIVEVDTFLKTLYVMVDAFCKVSLPPKQPPGRQATLSRSEVVTVALFRPCAWLLSPGTASPEGSLAQLPTWEQCNRLWSLGKPLLLIRLP